jgi:hypothetical protein
MADEHKDLKDVNYDHDYERAVWPEKFVDVRSDIGLKHDLWQERVLLALQGIDISLEEMAKRASKKDDELPDVGDGN